MRKNMEGDINPTYRTWSRDKMFRSVAQIKVNDIKINPNSLLNKYGFGNENKTVFFSSESWEKNKRYSEQAAAVVALHCLDVGGTGSEDPPQEQSSLEKNKNDHLVQNM